MRNKENALWRKERTIEENGEKEESKGGKGTRENKEKQVGRRMEGGSEGNNIEKKENDEREGMRHERA